MNQAIRDQIEALWARIKPALEPQAGREVMWDYQITPLFPLQWPPGEDRRFRQYLFAYGFAPTLLDGRYVAAPWAQIDRGPQEGTEPALSRVPTQLRQLGIQGVWPLATDEHTVYQQQAEVEEYLRSLTTMPAKRARQAAALRRFYCQWLRFNGVIGNHIRHHHEPFFAWLACAEA